MRRREFLTLLGSTAAAWPLAARAQRGDRVRRIGMLMNGVETDPDFKSYLAAFTQGLRNLGWLEGQNLHIELRWNTDRARTSATELLRLAPDVILSGGTANLTALLQQGPTMPIVFVEVSDPIAQGFVSNLAHPGGNITGFTYFEVQTAGKWLDLLKQIAPGVRRVAVIFNPETSPPSLLFSHALKDASTSFGIEVVETPVHAAADIEPAIDRFSREPNSGLIFTTDQFLQARARLVVELTAQYRLPAIYAREGFAEIGGLMSYYPSVLELFQRAASYVDRILRGERPGDLPVQNPTKYDLVINLKTAKALGLTVAPTLLAIADEVIE